MESTQEQTQTLPQEQTQTLPQEQTQTLPQEQPHQQTQDLNWKKTSLALLEKQNIKYWNNIGALEYLNNRNKQYPETVFLAGPPFATGSMHFGHILVSTVKDTMARFFTMNEKFIDRRNGWDVHGVPIEMLAKKIIGYTTKEELLAYGIDNHNDRCREIISDCTGKWYKDFERLGHWVDTKREYKTMDPTFMESVIWVFNELYSKKMIYEGVKIMPYSTGCGTPLSHFEAKQNYKDVTEPAIICQFEVVSTEFSTYKLSDTNYPTFILVWTTTPWTLFGNLCICTGPNIPIVVVHDKQSKQYVMLSKFKFDTSFKKLKFENQARFEIKSQINSADLVNLEYKPLFNYCQKSPVSKTDADTDTIPNPNPIPITDRIYRIVSDSYVKSEGKDAGTGFVHINPSNGEDDYRVCCENQMVDSKNTKGNLVDLINDDGCFIDGLGEYTGVYIKDADKKIIAELKARGLLFESKNYTHSYPFCYRTDTPLVYKMVKAWFLNASDPIFRQQMINNATKINWNPSFVGTNFVNWLSGSVDWCISRTRYWGTPIPVWKSADNEEVVSVGSVAELEELSGVKNISDLHIEVVDKIEIPSKQGKGMLKRVPDVLDCWFESGSVPYGQQHYPFNKNSIIATTSPAISDFVIESLDQTRGWFYTLNVLSTALFNKPPFLNVIVTGIVNAADGEKMSKSKGNYPDPNILMDKYGSDVLRLYLLSTPVVKAVSIKFDEKNLAKLQQGSTVKLYNMSMLLVEKINMYNIENPTNKVVFPDAARLESNNNILDKWIISKTGILAQDMYASLNSYQVSNIAAKILCYVEQLTNWYVKMARERLKGSASNFEIDTNSCKQSIETLLYVMYQFTRIAAPILPFMCETIYQMIGPYLLSATESVHYEYYPKPGEIMCDLLLEAKFNIVQKVITLIRDLRDSLGLNNRRPISSVEIGCINPKDWPIIQDILDYIKTESNVMHIKELNLDNMVNSLIEPIMGELSTYLKDIGHIKNMKTFTAFINNMTNGQIKYFCENKCITEPSTNVMLTTEHISFKYEIAKPDPTTKLSGNMVIRVDTSYTDQLKTEHMNRLINSSIQMHRKEIMLKPWQNISIKFYSDAELSDFVLAHADTYCGTNLASIKLVDRSELLANQTTHKILETDIVISSELIG